MASALGFSVGGWKQQSFHRRQHRSERLPSSRTRKLRSVQQKGHSPPRDFHLYGWFPGGFGRGWLCRHLEEGTAVEGPQQEACDAALRPLAHKRITIYTDVQAAIRGVGSDEPPLLSTCRNSMKQEILAVGRV